MDSSVSSDSNSAPKQEKADVEKPNYTKRGLFFLGITTIAAIGSFGAMLARTERQDQKTSPNARPNPAAMETGASLARRALGRATVYAVGGFSLFCFVSWKLIGAKDFEEFRMKLGNAFPRIHRPREPEEIDWDEILNGKSDKVETPSTGNEDV